MSVFRAWPETDRLLALALQAYEDGLCSGCGMPLAQSMDGDLLDEWTSMTPHRCGGCTAIAKSAEKAEKAYDYPQAMRHIPALPEGWERRKASAVAARAAKSAASSEPDHQ